MNYPSTMKLRLRQEFGWDDEGLGMGFWGKSLEIVRTTRQGPSEKGRLPVLSPGNRSSGRPAEAVVLRCAAPTWHVRLAPGRLSLAPNKEVFSGKIKRGRYIRSSGNTNQHMVCPLFQLQKYHKTQVPARHGSANNENDVSQ